MLENSKKLYKDNIDIGEWLFLAYARVGDLIKQ